MDKLKYGIGDKFIDNYNNEWKITSLNQGKIHPDFKYLISSKNIIFDTLIVFNENVKKCG